MAAGRESGKPETPELPVVLVKWYDYAKWLLERVEGFPKSQRFVIGQRISNLALDVLEALVEATYARKKAEALGRANRKIELVRWMVRMAKDRGLMGASQFQFSAERLDECGRMVGGWLKRAAV